MELQYDNYVRRVVLVLCDVLCDVAHSVTVAFLEGRAALKWEELMSGRSLRHMEWSTLLSHTLFWTNVAVNQICLTDFSGSNVKWTIYK